MSQPKPRLRDEIERLDGQLTQINQILGDCFLRLHESHTFLLKNVCSIEHIEDSKNAELKERIEVLEGIILKSHNKSIWAKLKDIFFG